jgi:hypothetical protein
MFVFVWHCTHQINGQSTWLSVATSRRAGSGCAVLKDRASSLPESRDPENKKAQSGRQEGSADSAAKRGWKKSSPKQKGQSRESLLNAALRSWLWLLGLAEQD